MSDFNSNATSRWGASEARGNAGYVDQGLRQYMLGVYNYMTTGLALTGAVALGINMIADTPLGFAIQRGPLHIVVALAPLAFVFFFSFRLNQMAASTARIIFLLFAATMGLSLSTLLTVYTGQSITRAFFITAAAFGSLSLYGYTTKRDLSAFGSFLVMGLFGLIIASFVNMFMQSGPFQFALSFLSVLIFAGLTAWDTQSIKDMYYEADDHEVATKKSIFGALQLYLDFINIFVSLLQLTGSRND
jgi:uncharacterized protein